MVQLRGSGSFLLESAEQLGRCIGLDRRHLERDLTLRERVVRAVHDAETAGRRAVIGSRTGRLTRAASAGRPTPTTGLRPRSNNSRQRLPRSMPAEGIVHRRQRRRGRRSSSEPPCASSSVANKSSASGSFMVVIAIQLDGKLLDSATQSFRAASLVRCNCRPISSKGSKWSPAQLHDQAMLGAEPGQGAIDSPAGFGRGYQFAGGRAGQGRPASPSAQPESPGEALANIALRVPQ